MDTRLKSVRAITTAGLLSFLLAVPYTAFGALFAPGESKAVDAVNFPAGIVADPLRPFTIDFGGGLSISGNVQDRVERLADGTLAFGTYIRDITGTAGSLITSFGRGSFLDPTVNVTFDPTSLGAASPSLGQRSADGKVVTVFYDPGFPLTSPAADGNKFVEVRTTETQYAEIGDLFITARGPNAQFGSTKLTVFAPVPEPGTYALVLSGVALMLCSFYRRDSKVR